MIWLLADDRAGNVNQLLGIAESLNTPFERKDIRYTKWVKLPNFLRGATFLGITDESKQNLHAPWPEVVLSAGRRTFPVALAIKRLSGGHTRIVQLMNPGKLHESKCDLLILPQHDQYRGHASNVMQVVGTPHRVSDEKLTQERQKWQEKFSPYPHPRISLIIGGATKDHPFTVQAAEQLVRDVIALKPASLLITTSRRTPADVVALLKEKLPEPKFFYAFGSPDENPYFGLLSSADQIVVTGDSMSMCSECCASHVPVSIFAPDEMIGKKHAKFHQTLYAGGFAVPLGDTPKQPQGQLNPAPEIANRIRKEFLCKSN